MPFIKTRMLLILTFLSFLLFVLSITNKSFAQTPTPLPFVSCTGSGQTCEIEPYGDCLYCDTAGVGACNYKWGTQYADGRCYDSSQGKYIGTCQRTRGCCCPGQGTCTTNCSGTCSPICANYPPWEYTGPCTSTGSECVWNGSSYCGPNQAKSCQTVTKYFCYEGPPQACGPITGCDPNHPTQGWRCFETSSACNAGCGIPSCTISDVNTSAKTVTMDGTNLEAKGYNTYQFSFSPSGGKTVGIPSEDQTVSYTEFPDSTGVSVRALSPTAGVIDCGSQNWAAGSCQQGVTYCGNPGGYATECNGGFCNATSNKCDSCIAPVDGGWSCAGTCPTLNAEYLRNGTIVATASANGTHKIEFNVYRVGYPNSQCPSIGMQSTANAYPHYNLWWGGNGCGTVSYDSPLDYSTGITWQDTDRTAPKLNRFKSSLLKRGKYYIQDFWLTNREPTNGDSCSYVIDCNEYTGAGASTDLQDLPQDANHRPDTSCETNRGASYNRVYPASVKYSCGPKNELYLRVRTTIPSGKGQIRLYYPYDSVVQNYTGNANWDQIRTPLCIQQSGASAGTEDVNNGADDNKNGEYQCRLGRDDFFDQELLYFFGNTNPDTNNDKRTRTWRATEDREYEVKVTTAIASGNCTCTTKKPLGVFDPRFYIAGQIFEDRDGEFDWDAGEPVYTNTSNKFYVTSPGGVKYTRAQGKYKIDGLKPNVNYSVILADVSNFRTTVPGSTYSVVIDKNKGDEENIDFGIAPYRTIKGNVFVDIDGDGRRDPEDVNYTSSHAGFTGNFGIDLVQGGFGVEGLDIDPTNGTFTLSKATAGTEYQIKVISPPEYIIRTNPNPVSSLVVGSKCSNFIAVGGGLIGGSCAGVDNEEIINLNFGITPSKIWFQGRGGDMRIDSGFDDPITLTSPYPYVSLKGSGNTPGVVFSGGGLPIEDYDFGAGSASETGFNWVAGGKTYPEIYNEKIKTSYDYLKYLAQRNKQTITPLGDNQCGIGGVGACDFNQASSFNQGVYESSSNLRITANYTFPDDTDYVILVNGDLFLEGEIHVPKPNGGAIKGSTVIFSVTGNIYVDDRMGGAYNSEAPHLEGVFTADNSFIARKADSQSCPNSPGERLNIEGSIIVNANPSLNGDLKIERDLCQQSTYPSLYISERPDFYLNLPRYVMTADWIWQEVAP